MASVHKQTKVTNATIKQLCFKPSHHTWSVLHCQTTDKLQLQFCFLQCPKLWSQQHSIN